MKKFVANVDVPLMLPIITLLILLGFMAQANAAQAADARINRYVVAVSANYGGNGRPMLRYAESDAKSFANVLKEMGGVQGQNVMLVKEPSVAQLKDEFSKLDKKIAQVKLSGGRNEVLVYYSGHADDKGLRLGNETYAWREIRNRIDALNADVKIAVIDACGSGAITRAKGGVAVPAFMVDESSDMKGYAFITSSTQDESSQESDRLKGSFFTHSLVSGLRGAGDISGDGRVTLSEAYQFAFNETLQKTEATMGGAQHPSRDMNLAGTGDVVMTDLHGTGALLDMANDVDGRLFIRNANGELVAELNKKNGHPVSLGLPAGKYSVRLETTAKVKETTVTLANGKRENLALSSFKDAEVEKTVLRGEIGNKNDCASGNASDCSIDSLDHNGSFRTTFNFLDIDRNPRKGMQLGLFFTVSKDYMLGSQISILANVAKKEMHGLQASSVANLAANHFEGLQATWLLNYAKTFEGAQLSGTINVAKSFEGAQIAGGFNISRDASTGAQIAPINIAADTVSLAQVGAINVGKYSAVQVGAINVTVGAKLQWGAINVAADSVSSLQIGAVNAAKYSEVQVGAVNVTVDAKHQWGAINAAADSVSFLQIGAVNAAKYSKFQISSINASWKSKYQIGTINVTGKSNGRQFGIINVCGNCEKTPIGLINIVGNGLWTASGIFNEMGGVGAKLDLGTANFYTSLETSRNFEDGERFRHFEHIFQNGFGLGTHFGKYGSHFAAEYMLVNVNRKFSGNYGVGSDDTNKSAFLHRIRLGATQKLIMGIGLTGGVSLNLMTEGYNEDNMLKPLGEYHADVSVNGHEGRLWPGFYAGLTIGRF